MYSLTKIQLLLFVFIFLFFNSKAQFTAGNITVLKVGNGTSSPLTSQSYAEYISEYSTAGTLIQTISIPNTIAGARVTESGSATSDGDLNLSGDGRYLTFAGYDAAAGTAGVVSAAGTLRMIAQLDNSGSVSFPVTLNSSATTGFYQGNNIRSVTTNDGTGYYTSGTGTNGGINYFPAGVTAATTSTTGIAQFNSSSTNMRTVRIFNNQLYGNSASGSYKDPFTIGSGIPTSGSQTFTVLNNMPNNHDGYGFVLFDKNRDGTPDLMYIADNTSGLLKYFLNSVNAWTSAGVLTNGITGITGYLDCSNNPVLFVTTASSGPVNNKLYKYTDVNAPSISLPTSSLALSATLLASAGTGYIFRGVAMAPTFGDATLTAATNLSGSYRNIFINAGTATLTGNVNVTDSVYVASGATLDCGNFIIKGKSFVLASGALLKMGSANGIAASTASGNIQTSCRNFSTGASYEYEGSTAQISGDGLPQTVYNLTMNNSSTGVTLSDSVFITNQLNLTSGVLYSTSIKLLRMSSTSSVAGVSNTSYVDGPLKKYGNTSFIFPVGDNGYYSPVTMTSPSLISDNFTAQYFDNDPNTLYNVSLADVTIDHLSRCEYWILNRTGGSSNVFVTLSWDTPRSCGIDQLADLLVCRWDGTMWKDEGNSMITGSIVNGEITSGTGVSSFSPFTLGSNSGFNPLPISLLSFEAVNVDSVVNITWSTATETNNDYFSVQRSVDMKSFESITKVKGAGNSSNINEYSYVDASPLYGTSYYRLEQTDYNGGSTHSEIKSVTINKSLSFLVFPNPATNEVTITIPANVYENVIAEIYDVYCKRIFLKKCLIENDESLLKINVSEIKNGVYFIRLSDSENTTLFAQKIIKQ